MVCLAPHFGVRREVFRLLTRYFNYNLVNMGGIFIYPGPIPCIKVTQMELYKQLANFFTGVRLKKCGQTQKHFSKLISLPSHRISGLENSTVKPTIDDVDVYAKYLGVTVGDVFRAIEGESPPLYIYVQAGADYNLQRSNKSSARAFGMLEKLSAEEKRAALKVLNGEQYDTTGLI